jgi:hypothetical protein
MGVVALIDFLITVYFGGGAVRGGPAVHEVQWAIEATPGARDLHDKIRGMAPADQVEAFRQIARLAEMIHPQLQD